MLVRQDAILGGLSIGQLTTNLPAAGTSPFISAVSTAKALNLGDISQELRGMIQNNVEFSHKNDSFHCSILKL